MGPLRGPDLDLFSFLILLLLLDSAYISSDFLSYSHLSLLGTTPLRAGWDSVVLHTISPGFSGKAFHR